MAVIPKVPDEGTNLILKNMREARSNGLPRGMALPQTYHWFYQKVRNGGPWDYKQQDRSLANFGNFNYGATGLAAGIPEKTLFMAAGFAQNRGIATTMGSVVWFIPVWRRPTRSILD